MSDLQTSLNKTFNSNPKEYYWNVSQSVILTLAKLVPSDKHRFSEIIKTLKADREMATKIVVDSDYTPLYDDDANTLQVKLVEMYDSHIRRISKVYTGMHGALV